MILVNRDPDCTGKNTEAGRPLIQSPALLNAYTQLRLPSKSDASMRALAAAVMTSALATMSILAKADELSDPKAPRDVAQKAIQRGEGQFTYGGFRVRASFPQKRSARARFSSMAVPAAAKYRQKPTGGTAISGN